MDDQNQKATVFQALLVEENERGEFTRRVVERSLADLPEGDVLVRVLYSSLNYKDALSAAGNKGVTRRYPHTPGIDAAGVVVESSSSEFRPGEPVLAATGAFGASAPGGYSQYIRVPADWLVPLPAGLTPRESMIFGTAGFTAGMCVEALQWAGVQPDQGEILVTGASGGVGTIATAILAREGYHVAAATGKPESEALLRRLGAERTLNREAVDDESGRPLLHARWAGVVDTVGGRYLSAAIRATRPGGAVAACGNAASPDLSLTVYPFILRGVRLLGIDATLPTREERSRLWQKLAGPWKLDALDELAREVPLEQLDQEIERILRGGQTGRVIVHLA